MYRIEVSYETGDSFNSHDIVDEIPLEWKKLEKAEEALARIKEHYQWYTDSTCTSALLPKKPIKPKWVNVPKDTYTSDKIYCFNLQNDEDEEIKIHPFWCGYFETLYGADIKSKKLSITI